MDPLSVVVTPMDQEQGRLAVESQLEMAGLWKGIIAAILVVAMVLGGLATAVYCIKQAAQALLPQTQTILETPLSDALVTPAITKQWVVAIEECRGLVFETKVRACADRFMEKHTADPAIAFIFAADANNLEHSTTQ